jgi:hypothetical protein
MILRALKNTFFEGRTAIVVAFCVSMLGILGLHQTFFTAGEIHDRLKLNKDSVEERRIPK